MKKSKSFPSFDEERNLWARGYEFVIGVDEVGRGAFAGPVVAAAVVFPKTCDLQELKEVNDSKLLTARDRTRLSTVIKENCLAFSIDSMSVDVINKFGIGKATTMTIRKAIKVLFAKYQNLSLSSSYLLTDGFHIKYIQGLGIKRQRAIIKGDQKSITIAAASIIAKVYRDNYMSKLHKDYKNYHLVSNKGYGTQKHIQALHLYGLSQIHRTSFKIYKYL